MDMISGNVPCVSDPYRNVDTDYGRFILTGAGTLLRVTVIVTRDNVCDMSGRAGFYCATGYTSIVEAPGCADIEGIPVWLPGLGRYGCWGRDSSLELHLYPANVTWQHIESDLEYYTSFQESDSCCFSNVWKVDSSERAFDFVPDDLLMEAEAITAAEENEQMASGFIDTYEPILQRHVLCAELDDSFTALVLIYKFKAQLCLIRCKAYSREARAEEIVGWYERCVPIIDQYQANEMVPNPVFADVFLLLSFWYSDAERFEEAFRYAERWLAYDPSVTDAYDELYRMLLIKRQLGAENFDGKLHGSSRE